MTNEPNNSLPNDSLEMMLPEMPASSQVFINENHLRRQKLISSTNAQILVQNQNAFDYQPNDTSCHVTNLPSFQNSVLHSQVISRQPSTTPNQNIPLLRSNLGQHVHTGSSGSAYGLQEKHPHLYQRSNQFLQYPSIVSASQPSQTHTAAAVPNTNLNFQSNYSSVETNNVVSPLLREDKNHHQAAQKDKMDLDQLLAELAMLRKENGQLKEELAAQRCQQCKKLLEPADSAVRSHAEEEQKRPSLLVTLSKALNENMGPSQCQSRRVSVEAIEEESEAFQGSQLLQSLQNSLLKPSELAGAPTDRPMTQQNTVVKAQEKSELTQERPSESSARPRLVLNNLSSLAAKKQSIISQQSGEHSKRSDASARRLKQSIQKSGISKRSRLSKGHDTGMSPIQLFTLSSQQNNDEH